MDIIKVILDDSALIILGIIAIVLLYKYFKNKNDKDKKK